MQHRWAVIPFDPDNQLAVKKLAMDQLFARALTPTQKVVFIIMGWRGWTHCMRSKGYTIKWPQGPKELLCRDLVHRYTPRTIRLPTRWSMDFWVRRRQSRNTILWSMTWRCKLYIGRSLSHRSSFAVKWKGSIWMLGASHTSVESYRRLDASFP